MKRSAILPPIITLALVMLLGSGLVIAGAGKALADDDRERGKSRWEERAGGERQHRAEERERQEYRREIRSDRHRNSGRPDVVERRQERREQRQEIRNERHRNDRGDRGPAINRNHRPQPVRERTVIRSVSRPHDSRNAHIDRRPSTIVRPESRHLLRPQREVILKTLPRGSRTVILDRERYHTHRGRYYRNTPRGYLLVRPPLGTVVADLPFGFFRVSFGGLDYFVWENVFYRRTSYGYRVVETPRGYQLTDHGPVRVEASLLNIRSGPGLGYGIIGRLRNGEWLMVTAVAPDWYYVLLPDGGYGWVMRRHTSPVARG